MKSIILRVTHLVPAPVPADKNVQAVPIHPAAGTFSGPSSVSDASRATLVAQSGVVQLTLYLSIVCAAIAREVVFHTHTLQHAVGCSMPHFEVHAVQQRVHKA